MSFEVLEDSNLATTVAGTNAGVQEADGPVTIDLPKLQPVRDMPFNRNPLYRSMRKEMRKKDRQDWINQQMQVKARKKK